MTGLRIRLGLLGASLVGLTLAGLAYAYPPPNERDVKPAPNVQDTDDISSPDSKVWVLDFKFKDPRVIKANVPGRGQKVCWYLWYQVANYSKEPHTFIPEFELVTQDSKTRHPDQILPSVQDAIQQIEDPTNFLKIKNSVTIAAEPIPVSVPKATPKLVSGVAIWDDVDPESNVFTIFVKGLSNGWALSDPVRPGGPPVVRRKTLQLDFKRLGDKYVQRSEDVRFLQPAKWIYLGSEVTDPKLASQLPSAKPVGGAPDK